MKNYYDGFKIAWTMLTIVPLFSNFKDTNYGYVVTSYPMVGMILGLILLTIYSLASQFLPHIHLMVIIFGLYTLLYGALHLDGFADVVDGWFASLVKDPLQVMKDPHIGSMGVVFLFILMSIKLSSFIYLHDLLLLIPILMLSRYSSVLAIYYYDYIGGGMGKRPKEDFTKKHLVTTTLVTLVLSVVFFKLFIFIIIPLLLLSTYIITHILDKKFGGLNGDMYGMMIELNEIILLQIAIAIWS